MFTINVMKKLIGLDLKYEDSFSNAYKYKVEDNPKIIIKSSFIDKPIECDNLIRETDYFKMYLLDGVRYQVQYENNEVIGTIKYGNDLIEIGLVKKSFVTEYLLTQYAYVNIIGKNGGFLMHGSSLMYKNSGIIFTAPSGTGKSTHSRLWQKYTDSVVVNDDKNTLLIEDDKLMLYPSPWSGKHRLDNNIICELRAIVFLYQNKENVIEELKPSKALKLLLSQVDAPNEDNLDLWNKMTDKLLDLPCYRYGCNMEKEAFDIINERLVKDLCL